MAPFTTALGLYGGVLWSGELQGFIIHEMMPIAGIPETKHQALKHKPLAGRLLRPPPAYGKRQNAARGRRAVLFALTG
jgi:hypothetical protein